MADPNGLKKSELMFSNILLFQTVFSFRRAYLSGLLAHFLFSISITPRNCFIIPYEKKMPLTEELKYFAAHTNGDSVKTADAQNGAEVLEILEKASESLLQDSGLRDKGLKGKDEIEKLYFGHESAVIDNNVEIGSRTKIWHFSHILSGSHIGKNCNIGQNVVRNVDEITSPTMHHSFRPSLPDLQSQKS